jgi:hypothetical protein
VSGFYADHNFAARRRPTIVRAMLLICVKAQEQEDQRMKPIYGLALTLLSAAALVASTRLSQGDTCPPPQPTTHCDGTWRKHQLGVANIGTNCTVVWMCARRARAPGGIPSAAGPTTGTVQPMAPPGQR